jgi:AcrR family transcriptional regulator
MQAVSKKSEIGKRRQKNTKQKILVAGRKIFAEKGYNQTRIQDLLKAAGVSPGAFYNYFSNKEELFLELVREAGEALRNSVQEIRVKGIKAEYVQLLPGIDKAVDIFDLANCYAGPQLATMESSL